MHVPRPVAGEFQPQTSGYIARAADMSDALSLYAAQRKSVVALLSSLPEGKTLFRYAPGKWSVKEMIGHLSDAERILSYRMLRIARGDVTPLAGFEEDDYVRSAATERRPWVDVVGEWEVVRRATEALIGGMPPDAWTRHGLANNHPVTAGALLYTIFGHVEHHRAILAERYGIGAR